MFQFFKENKKVLKFSKYVTNICFYMDELQTPLNRQTCGYI